ncbi:MAG: ACT domain-containing protein [Actinomycetota bacterium]|nr:ACT domain-containing protein [Actinomycetota bacterium]
MAPALRLKILPGDYAVCRLDPDDDPPLPAAEGLFSVTRTDEEISIVCPVASALPAARAEGPFTALRVAGTLDFSLTGVLASLTSALAEVGVSVFAISTYDTDYMLVSRDRLPQAVEAIRSAGHEVEGL